MVRKNIWKQLLNKLNTTGGTFVIICTIFSLGFGSGLYVANVYHKIELNDISMKHNRELIDRTQSYDDKIDSFKKEINELRQENLVLLNKSKDDGNKK